MFTFTISAFVTFLTIIDPVGLAVQFVLNGIDQFLIASKLLK